MLNTVCDAFSYKLILPVRFNGSLISPSYNVMFLLICLLFQICLNRTGELISFPTEPVHIYHHLNACERTNEKGEEEVIETSPFVMNEAVFLLVS